MTDIYTYRDLRDYLNSLPDEKLGQKVQVTDPCGPDDDGVQELCPVISIGTVGEMEFYGARSMVDNKYHPEEIVILADRNPFSKDGAIAYDMLDEETFRPVYTKAGPTQLKDQLAPEEKPDDSDSLLAHEAQVIKRRPTGTL